jgi:hypothetical protein
MAIVAFIFVALLALMPLDAGAHVGQLHESAPLEAAHDELARPPSAWPAPCPGGSLESCACRSLAECPHGKAATTSAIVVLPLSSAGDRTVFPRIAPRGARFFPASRPRSPPASF